MHEAQLGDTVEADFSTHGETGANAAADSTPTVTVYKNGSAVGALTNQNATSFGTGLYRYTFAASSGNGFSAGDLIQVVSTAVIGGVTSSIVLKTFKVKAWQAEVTAIKAKTDNLPSDPADASDIAGSFSTVNTTLSTIAGYLDTEVAAIKAKTDNLPSDPADASDIASSFSTVNTSLGTIAGYLDTEISAIKAKTDNLPGDPADASDIAGSFSTVNTTLSTIAGYLDTEVAAIKAKTDNLPAAPASSTNVSDAQTAILAKLLKYVRLLARKDAATATDQATELTEINANAGSGAGGYANTTNSLESGFEASVTLPAVDGLAFEDAIAAILAAIVGVRNVSDNVVTFYARDGVTLLGTLTIGDTAGVIDSSVLAAD